MNKNKLNFNIRNFCIIAHINHGKSTLSNKIIEYCNNNFYKKNIKSNEPLDNLEIEKKRGITIKSKNITLNFNYKNNLYKFNLIDTPGHADFYSEIIKIINVCNGALLVIDSTKGIQSQTIFNYNLAKDNNLNLIFVINKVDLKLSNTNKIIDDIKNYFNLNEFNYVLCSSKTGYGIDNLVEKIIKFISKPNILLTNNLEIIILDVKFNNYLGIILTVYIKSGYLIKGSKIFNKNNNIFLIIKLLGIFNINNDYIDILNSGDIGWISFTYKKIMNFYIGDTIYNYVNKYEKNNNISNNIESNIYCSLFTKEYNEFNKFEKSIVIFSLSDCSFKYNKEYSNLFGFGFKCGFISLLHMEVVIERLEKEFNLKLIYTFPNIEYKIYTKNNKIINIKNPSDIYKYNIKYISEPISICEIITPNKYMNNIVKLCLDKRGVKINILNYNNDNYKLIYYIPISEIINNFFDDIKSISNGYAYFNYKFSHFEKTKLFIIEIEINNYIINQLTCFVSENNIKSKILYINNKLSELIHRKQFDIVIKILLNKKVVSKKIIKQFRKDVISKCYGGDISRKKKLLDKQKKGKKKIKKNNTLNVKLDEIKSIFYIN
ncbi:translation elongation factor 4 [endosymbiont of Pachyrhynchus infernalis]|uniref:translation elongation factor 4 n=1 Tax=endosymbiont of Pachyrhynchus infernalis TaxID=1971488 RepID=UPI000DC70EA8|nr:translation elongation factor 4 [endosymbiont of Pachyrhynchus infernalis]BBA84784.1 elongation factor 4 [endosymbiont of Pachyrhynchus infernalis]